MVNEEVIMQGIDSKAGEAGRCCERVKSFVVVAVVVVVILALDNEALAIAASIFKIVLATSGKKSGDNDDDVVWR